MFNPKFLGMEMAGSAAAAISDCLCYLQLLLNTTRNCFCLLMAQFRFALFL